MAEAIISPGVFQYENDQSFIEQGPIAVGAAIIGPTVKGPVNYPTVVTSYSDFANRFGSVFITGSSSEEYITSVAVYNYFQQGGDSLIVTRVVSGSSTTAPNGGYAPASASVLAAGVPANLFVSTSFADGAFFSLTGSYAAKFFVTSSTTQTDAAGVYYVVTGSSIALTTANVAAKINSLTATMSIVASAPSASSLLLSASFLGTGGNAYSFRTGSAASTFTASVNGGVSFVLETLAAGSDQNNNQGTYTGSLLAPTLGVLANGYLPSGSNNNIRWEIVASDSSKGLFSLTIRRGDDYQNTKTVLETWSNLSLDPTSPNYIEYQIGNMTAQPVVDENGDWNLKFTGSYMNKSRYVRVQSVTSQPTYFNNDGTVNTVASASMPALGSGSYHGAFGGGVGDVFGGYSNGTALRLFDQIGTGGSISQNIQGLIPSNYNVAVSLLKSKDWYDYQVIYVPGLTYSNASSTLDVLLSNTEDRGDAIAIIDPVNSGATVASAVSAINLLDSNYAAAYWPWVQVRSYDTGKVRLLPASAIIPGVYAYSDKVSAEWFAPAGLNRGGLATVLSPESRLSKTNRDTLYNGRINPIAIFPGAGTVIYGQKTLQAKPSALDRVNVRRLLIQLKRTIGKIAENFLFEQNTANTRAKFVNQITPYLDTVQQKAGLYSFRVVMDETNNTPDVIDRNQLIGAIYLQPTKTVEFIVLDFNILPTGATFGK